MNTEDIIVYLSGGISGRTEDEAATHFAFVESMLEEEGKVVINPTRNPSRSSWEEYMRDGITAMLDSDCVVMLDGWKTSRGASLERSLAFELGISIYYEEDLAWALLEH